MNRIIAGRMAEAECQVRFIFPGFLEFYCLDAKDNILRCASGKAGSLCKVFISRHSFDGGLKFYIHTGGGGVWECLLPNWNDSASGMQILC